MADVDVVVIGAGLSGLVAARELARGGASVAVLEARDRVGGRLVRAKLDGAWVDLGGQWIGPGQRRMIALAEELGAATFPTYAAGRKVLDLRGRVSTYAGTIPSMSPIKLALMQLAISRVDRARKRVDPARPWEAPDAAALDAITLAGWQRLNVPSRDVRDLFDAAVGVVFGADSSELSLLYFLFYANAGEGLMHLVEIEGGAQQDRFVEGAHGVTLRLAAALGDRVHLSRPVRRVEQDAGGVTVHADGLTLRARAAVIAVPPALAGRIDYEPALPAARDALTQRFAMGAIIKCVAAYERPFWRDRGLSGEAVSTGGPVAVTFDNSPPDGSRGALVAFVVGGAARAWSARPAHERRREVLSVLSRLFGKEAGDPVDYAELDWSAERWTRGCPVGTLPPGALTQLGASLREPVGRVCFAGTETATEYTGYMEGAVQAGERAAAEAAARL
jgi:monoamine oxidase